MKRSMALFLCVILVLGLVLNSSLALAAEDGLVDNGDGTSSYYENGTLVKETMVDINGVTYYFDANGIMVYNQVIEYEEKLYFFQGDGSMLKDAQGCIPDILSEKCVRAKSDGTLYCSEWYRQDEWSVKEYYGADGVRYDNGVYLIDGVNYAFRYGYLVESGPATVESNGKIYAVVGMTGQVVELSEGWNILSDATYYIKSGVLATGYMYQIDDKYYGFNDWNRLLTEGIYTVWNSEYTAAEYYYNIKSDGSHYIKEWGVENHWDGIKYRYFGADGKSYMNGAYEIDGSKYYFDSDGVNQRNVIFKHNDKWCAADENGVMTETTVQDGWVTNGNTKYYFENDIPITGLRKIGDYYYYFDDDGKMYADEEIWIDVGEEYRAKPDGTLYRNEFYWMDDTCYAYYGDDCNIQPRGLFEVDGKQYYSMGESLVTVGLTVSVDDKYYVIVDTGEAVEFNFPLPDKLTEGKVNVFVGVSWDVISVSEYFFEKYPEYKNKIVFWDMGLMGSEVYEGDYIELMNEFAAEDYPCIYILDTNVLTFEEDSLPLDDFDPVSNVGITDADYKESYAFTRQDGYIDGELKFLTWNANPNLFIYNKDIAEEVLGTSNPEEVQALIGTPEGFFKVAEQMKDAGYYMTSLIEEDGELATIINKSQAVYAPVIGADTFVSDINDKGYTDGVPQAGNEMGSIAPNVFGYFGDTYASEWRMEENFLACEGPVNYKWTGSYMGVTGTGNDVDADIIAGAFLKTFCCDKDTMKELYTRDYMRFFPNNKAAVAELIAEGTLSCGSAHAGDLLTIYDSAAKDLVKMTVGADTNTSTPDMSIPVESEVILVDSAFDDSDRDSGLYLEVKLTAESIEINDIPKEDKKIIETAFVEEEKTVAFILDMNVIKTIGKDKTKVTELNDIVTITIDIPEEYRENELSVMRLHDDKVDILEDLDDNPDTITIKTDKFSVYSLVYDGEYVIDDTEDDVTTSTEDANEPINDKTNTSTENESPDASISSTEQKGENDVSDAPSTGDDFMLNMILTLLVLSFTGMKILNKYSKKIIEK